MSAAGFFLLLAMVATADDRMLKVEQAEFEATRGLATALYEAGKKYYLGGYRKEAIHFFKRCLEIRPRNGPIGRLDDLLQDYDNPIWKKKRWRSPTVRTEAGFQKRVKKLDEKYTRALVELGNRSWKYRKEERFLERARGHYIRALQLTAGPYEVDAKGRLDLRVASIPRDQSDLLLAEDLVHINDRLYLRDSMLRAISKVDSVCEARSEHVLVRTVDSMDLAERLHALMVEARDRYIEVTGQTPSRALGLFVFPDQEKYQAYCRDSDNARHQYAAGFAHTADGFAVTYVQEAIEQISVHEGAHLFHFYAFGTKMPSWYEEGFATSFGGEGTMRFEGGKLETHLPMAEDRLAALSSGGFIPLDELLSGDAVEYIGLGQQQGRNFYAQSWALFTFFNTTEDRRFRELYTEWEGFALGSGFEEEGGRATSSTELFRRIFADALPDLESDLHEWVAGRVP